MLIIYLFMLISVLISVFLNLIALFFGKKVQLNLEKLSPYECGFNPLKKARVPFSLRFFLVIIIFLIFDVEIALLLPLGVFSCKWDYTLYSSVSLILISLMILGFIHEWNQGSLNWLK